MRKIPAAMNPGRISTARFGSLVIYAHVMDWTEGRLILKSEKDES